MRFRRLKLSGFKSFVEPAVLAIEPGLTGVVGPNGCGKSNLLEAIRWVMGEGSAKSLRGGGMEDVIFAGTATRPARDFAEVSLLIERDSDEEGAGEAEVTRRIERGAGSAYRLDGRDVRAKDVSLLFADAATGAHSPALVSQGRIGAVIAAKPTERRLMLEEAAGISGLHARRKDAEQKLRATEANLQRLDEIMGDQEARAAALRRQARAAARYRELSDKIRLAEARLVYARWAEADRAARAATDEAQAAEADVARLQADMLTAQRLQEHAATALAARRDAALVARDQGRNLAHQLATARAERDTVVRRLAELDRLDRQPRRRHRTRGRARRGCARARSPRSMPNAPPSMRGSPMPRRSPRGLPPTSPPPRPGRARPRPRSPGCSRATPRCAPNAASPTPRSRPRATRWRASPPTSASSPTRSPRSATAPTNALPSRRRLRRASRPRARWPTPNGASPPPSATAPTPPKRATKAKANSAARALRSARRARNAMLWRAPWPAAAGRRSPRSVPSPAMSARWPRRSATTSMPRSAATPRAAGRAAPLSPPIPRFPTAPSACSTASRRRPNWRGGWRRSRSSTRTGARLSRSANASSPAPGRCAAGTASSAAAAARRRPSACSASIASPSSTRRCPRSTPRSPPRSPDATPPPPPSTRHRAAAEQARGDAAAAERSARDSTRAGDAAQAALDRLDGQRAHYLERQGDLDPMARAAADALAAAEAAAAALPVASTLEADVAAARDAATAAGSAVADARAASATRARETAADRERHAAAGREAAEWRARVARAQERLADAAERQAGLAAERTDLADQPEQQALAIAAIEADAAASEGAVATSAAAERDAEQALAIAGQALATTGEAFAAAREARAGAAARAEGQASRRQEYARISGERFECPPPLLPERVGFDAATLNDPEEEKTGLERWTAERERIGPVNLVADQELAELEGAREQAVVERDELGQAIARLRGSIGSLNREGRLRLLAAFEQVDGHFRRLFTTLFDGGQAHLELVESDDPLEAGLEIMAQPPGKRLSSLTLLSGGEQALTAVALIFALFLTNPAPICVLDEVDAPLDDANVERFCDLLDAMSRETDTRYLIVTHNAVTMSRMHRLYGVTMIERGVSRLVSVDLGGAERLLAAE